MGMTVHPDAVVGPNNGKPRPKKEMHPDGQPPGGPRPVEMHPDGALRQPDTASETGEVEPRE